MRTCPICGEEYPESVKARWWKCFCSRKVDSIAILFSRRVIDSNGCWIYTGPESGEGYGAFAMVYKRKNTRNAHRTSFLIFKGAIPEGMEVHHTCHNRKCFNPEHLTITEIIDHRRLHNCVTHCASGHEYTPENIYMFRGSKKCRTCHRERQMIRHRMHKGWTSDAASTIPNQGNAHKTHCKNGHPFSGGNLKVLKNGKRQCLICYRNLKRLHSRKAYHSKHPNAPIYPERRKPTFPITPAPSRFQQPYTSAALLKYQSISGVRPFFKYSNGIRMCEA